MPSAGLGHPLLRVDPRAYLTTASARGWRTALILGEGRCSVGQVSKALRERDRVLQGERSALPGTRRRGVDRIADRDDASATPVLHADQVVDRIRPDFPRDALQDLRNRERVVAVEVAQPREPTPHRCSPVREPRSGSGRSCSRTRTQCRPRARGTRRTSGLRTRSAACRVSAASPPTRANPPVPTRLLYRGCGAAGSIQARVRDRIPSAPIRMSPSATRPSAKVARTSVGVSSIDDEPRAPGECGTPASTAPSRIT